MTDNQIRKMVKAGVVIFGILITLTSGHLHSRLVDVEIVLQEIVQEASQDLPQPEDNADAGSIRTESVGKPE